MFNKRFAFKRYKNRAIQMQCPQKVRHFLGAFFMNKKKKHSFEFKLSCVKQMDEDYRSGKSLGRELGITYSLLDTWYRIYKYHGSAGLLPKKGKRIFSPIAVSC